MAYAQGAKYVDKEFRALGANRVYRDRHVVEYEFPDGSRRIVNRGIGQNAAGALVAAARKRYDYQRAAPTVGSARPVRGEKPAINFDRLVASNHARERLEQMRAVEPITMAEITDTLRAPSHVLYSEQHESWLWVGHRISVAVTECDDGAQLITTVMWATADLWDAHPRVEKQP